MYKPYPVSACCFIRNNQEGAFCLWESVASFVPFVDEFVIYDLGSTDGTLDLLYDIASVNPKFRILEKQWPVIDAGAFATLANNVIADCKNENVLYFQADEIWHQDLTLKMLENWRNGKFDLAYWRIQYKENFQIVKWFPHAVHRSGPKDNMIFNGDGMNTNRVFGVDVCSDYDQSYFQKWHTYHQDGIKPFVNQMIMDVSKVGGFIENIIGRQRLHKDFWHEGMIIDGQDAKQWYDEQMKNPNWGKEKSPYYLPKIMEYHVGKTKYEVRPQLIEAIKQNDTYSMIGIA